MTLLRQLFYVLLIRPLLILILGLRVRHLERLKIAPRTIVAANHNSHLDALVLMSLIKFRHIPKVKLVAAKDYFALALCARGFRFTLSGLSRWTAAARKKTRLAPSKRRWIRAIPSSCSPRAHAARRKSASG